MAEDQQSANTHCWWMNIFTQRRQSQALATPLPLILFQGLTIMSLQPLVFSMNLKVLPNVVHAQELHFANPYAECDKLHSLEHTLQYLDGFESMNSFLCWMWRVAHLRVHFCMTSWLLPHGVCEELWSIISWGYATQQWNTLMKPIWVQSGLFVKP